jgi:hypothetical protein
MDAKKREETKKQSNRRLTQMYADIKVVKSRRHIHQKAICVDLRSSAVVSSVNSLPVAP